MILDCDLRACYARASLIFARKVFIFSKMILISNPFPKLLAFQYYAQKLFWAQETFNSKKFSPHPSNPFWITFIVDASIVKVVFAIKLTQKLCLRRFGPRNFIVGGRFRTRNFAV